MITRREALLAGGLGLLTPTLGTSSRSVLSQTPPASQPPISNLETLGGNAARTGEMPGTGPRLDLPIVRKWRASEDSTVQASGMPVIVDGVAFVATETNLTAVQADTGTELWQFIVWPESGGSAFQMYSPTVSNGIVYVNCWNDNLYALDAASGQQLWHFPMIGRAESSPAVADSRVYCGTGNHAACEKEGYLYAIDAATGTEIWHISTKEESSLGTPAVAEGTVYVCDFYTLYAFDAGSGAERWRFTGVDAMHAPAVADGTVYVNSSYRFWAIDAASGEEIWRLEDLPYAPTTPAVSDGVLYLAGDGFLAAFDTATGTQIWWFSANADLRGKPSVTDSLVYVAAHSPRLFAVDKATGAGIWFMSDAGYGPPAVVDDKIYMRGQFLNMISNLLPTMLVEDVVLRASPSSRGLERGQAAAGTVVDHLGNREERGGAMWVEVTVASQTGWIPLDAIDPNTLPPEGEIIYAEFY